MRSLLKSSVLLLTALGLGVANAWLNSNTPAWSESELAEGGKFSDHFVRIVESSTSTMSEKIAALSALSKKDAPGAEEILFKASQSDEVPLARMASELIKKNHF